MQTNPQPKASKRVIRAVAAVLTVAFLGFVFLAFGNMAITSGGELVKSVTKWVVYKEFLPEEWNQLDKLQARITSFTTKAAEVMWNKAPMGVINSDFQYALGKQVINTGAQNMIRLNTGHYYDFNDYLDLSENAREILALRETVLRDRPFLFVYEHPTLYAPDLMMPEDYAPLDHSAQMADEVIGLLREGGVKVMDSREVLNASGIPLDELLMVTDQHWTTRAAIAMAQAIAEEVNADTGAKLDTSLIDIDAFDTVVHEKLFLGKYGQRVGVGRVDPDDIIEYNPKYDTHLVRETKLTVRTERAEGTFPEAVMHRDRLEPDPGKSYNLLAYTYYGQVESYNIFTNDAAPDCTILLLKDSYSSPIGTFLSLVAKNVVAVDLRRDVKPLEYWVETWQPDIVVMAYSLQMLRDDAYQFGA